MDRYTPEWVLRQANAHGAEGSIEFHTDQPITIYLQGGRAYAAEVGVNLSETDLAERPVISESMARDHLVDLLAGVMGAQSGWYFHDPLGQHPTSGAWTWETATLLMDVRARTHETRSLASWGDRTVALREATAGPVTLGPDAWAVVVRLARTANAGDLRALLGWSPDRAAAALSELEDLGVLGDPPTAAPPPPPAAAPAPVAPGRPAPPTGPMRLSPPPTVAEAAAARRQTGTGARDSSASALRRVLPGRRPGS
ncbi:MAG TPA: hypothetical protein VNS19_08025 [Acidimicrobiales bacterium]|nr:hypothetical protein [Acidimicrobiales bacterium]